MKTEAEIRERIKKNEKQMFSYGLHWWSVPYAIMLAADIAALKWVLDELEKKEKV